MPPESPLSMETGRNVKMLAIIEQWRVGSSCHIDNTEKYLLLMFFKLGLDSVVFCLCSRKLHLNFFSMCSLSIVLADMLTAFFLTTVWFLGDERSPVTPCYLLAHASAIFAALPVPIMFLGLLDYCLADNHFCKQRASCRFLRNAIMVLLGWIPALIYSFSFAKTDLMVLDYVPRIKALVCEVEESTVVTYFIWVVFTAVVCAMLPYWSSIPQWLKEADRLSEAREDQAIRMSDLVFISPNCREAKCPKKNFLESMYRRPPLWLSLTLGFGMFWMPYLFVSVACQLFGFGVPAYITVNLLWLECANSLLMGVVFWTKSSTQGPYSHLPENVCLWHVYWHLSKGTGQTQLPMSVFNPSKVKRTALFYV